MIIKNHPLIIQDPSPTVSVWNGKPYFSLDHYLKSFFHEKIYKISLNGGMSCPNRDGKIATTGCIFCSEGGSGDFASSSELSITQQIEHGKLLLKNKFSGNKFIAYFQAFSNTYSSIEYLRKIFYEAINHPDIVLLSIATRPDCFSIEIYNLIEELNSIKPVWIELGLQSIHEKTANFIGRGYSLPCFEEAVLSLKERNIPVIAHVIIGLPSETLEDTLETVTYLSSLNIFGVKLQMLHILSRTELGKQYNLKPFSLLSLEEYCNIIVDCIERLPQDMVVHRITGDGSKVDLIAPLWSGNKRQVLNSIHKCFKERNTWQGKLSGGNNV